MYATVRTYSAGPELADALVSNAADVKSLITGIDGFKAYYLVRTADGAVSIMTRPFIGAVPGQDALDGVNSTTRL